MGICNDLDGLLVCLLSGSNASWEPRVQDVLQQSHLATASLLETRGTAGMAKLQISITCWAFLVGAAQVERWAQVSCEPGWGAVAEPTQGAARNSNADSVSELLCSLHFYGVSVLYPAVCRDAVSGSCLRSCWIWLDPVWLKSCPVRCPSVQCLPGMWREFVRLSQEPVSSCFRAGFISVARKND